MKFHHIAIAWSLSFGAFHVCAQGHAKAKDAKPAAKCELTIEGTDQMQYQVDNKPIDHIDVPAACKTKTFTVTLKHVGKLPKQVMGHNFVVTATKDAEHVNSEATKLGPAKGYLPDMKVEPFKSKVIATGDTLLSGGESEDIKIDMKKLKKGGDYTYFCTFPGHFGVMKGKFKVN